MRVIGPNCLGILTTLPEVSCNASFSRNWPPAGKVALVSQSGALGEAILADAAQAGLGVSMYASVGNRVDVTAADLVAYWGEDPEVQVILLYLETVGEPSEFFQVARAVAPKKPIIAVKSGRSDAGALAASSHTGSIAGADVAVDTLFQQCGVLRVDSFRDMFTLARALLVQPPPRGPRMAIVTNAGGPGILATDALAGLGMSMAQLAPATTAALRTVVRDPGVDGLVVMFVSPIMIDAAAVARAIVDETRGLDRPVLACVMGRQGSDEAQELLDAAGVPV